MAREGADRVVPVFLSALKRTDTDPWVTLKLLGLLQAHRKFARYLCEVQAISTILSCLTNDKLAVDTCLIAADLVFGILQGEEAAKARKAAKAAKAWTQLTAVLRSLGNPNVKIAAVNIAGTLLETDLSDMVESNFLDALLVVLTACVGAGEVSAAAGSAAVAAAASGVAPASGSVEAADTEASTIIAMSPAPAIVHFLHALLRVGGEAASEAVLVAPARTPLLSTVPLTDLIRACINSGVLLASTTDLVLASARLLALLGGSHKRGSAVRHAMMEAGLPRVALALLHIRGDAVDKVTAAQHAAATLLDLLTRDEPVPAASAEAVTSLSADSTGAAPPPPPAGLPRILCPTQSITPSTPSVWNVLLEVALKEHTFAAAVVSMIARAVSSDAGRRRVIATAADVEAKLVEFMLSADKRLDGVRKKVAPLLWLLCNERARYVAARWARNRVLWRRYRAGQEAERATRKAAWLVLHPEDKKDEAAREEGDAAAAYDWKRSGAWDVAFTVEGWRYFVHKDSGTAQWCVPTTDLAMITLPPDVVPGPIVEYGVQLMEAPRENDWDAMHAFKRLWDAGYYRSMPEEGDASLSTEAEAAPAWWKEDAVVRMCMAAVAAESLCSSPFINPNGAADAFTPSLAVDGGAVTEAELAADPTPHWPTVTEEVDRMLVRDCRALVREAVESLEAGRKGAWKIPLVFPRRSSFRSPSRSTSSAALTGSKLGRSSHAVTVRFEGTPRQPSSGDLRHDSFSASSGHQRTSSFRGSTADAEPFDRALGLSAAPTSTEPVQEHITFRFCQDHLTSLARIARCHHPEVVVFAAFVMREAVGDPHNATKASASGAAATPSLASAVAAAAAAASHGELPPSPDGGAGALMSPAGGMFSPGSTFGSPVPAMPPGSMLRGAGAGAGAGGKESAILNAVAALRTLTPAHAGAGAGGLLTPQSRPHAGSSAGVAPSSPPVVTAIPMQPLAGATAAPSTSSSAAPAAPAAPTLPVLPYRCAANVITSEDIDVRGGASSSHALHYLLTSLFAHAPAEGSAAAAAGPDTAWQYSFNEGTPIPAAKETLIAAGAKVGVRTAHFRLKLANPEVYSADKTPNKAAAPASQPAAPPAAPADGAGGPLSPSSVKKTGFWFFGSAAASGGNTAPPPVPGSGSGSDAPATPTAAKGPVKATATASAGAAKVAPQGDWELGHVVVNEVLLLLHGGSMEDAGIPASSVMGLKLRAVLSAKDAFLALKARSAARALANMRQKYGINAEGEPTTPNAAPAPAAAAEASPEAPAAPAAPATTAE